MLAYILIILSFLVAVISPVIDLFEQKWPSLRRLKVRRILPVFLIFAIVTLGVLQWLVRNNSEAIIGHLERRLEVLQPLIPKFKEAQINALNLGIKAVEVEAYIDSFLGNEGSATFDEWINTYEPIEEEIVQLAKKLDLKLPTWQEIYDKLLEEFRKRAYPPAAELRPPIQWFPPSPVNALRIVRKRRSPESIAEMITVKQASNIADTFWLGYSAAQIAHSSSPQLIERLRDYSKRLQIPNSLTLSYISSLSRTGSEGDNMAVLEEFRQRIIEYFNTLL